MNKPMYLLKGTFYRNKEANSNNLIEINEEFYDEEPIVARIKSIKMFQSYIEVLLDGKNLSYQTHLQAEKALQSYIDSGKRQFAQNNPDLIIDTDFDKGLYLYFIPEPKKKTITREGETIYEEKHCIHYVDNNMIDLRRYVLNSLIFEFNYYRKHNFNMGNQECWTYKKGISGKIRTVSVLNTPNSDLFKAL